MHDCYYTTPDDYPCPEEGVVKIGAHWYCEFHADDVQLEEEDQMLIEMERDDYEYCSSSID